MQSTCNNSRIWLALLFSMSLGLSTYAPAQSSYSDSANSPTGIDLTQITVIGRLDAARDQIVPYLGATKYSIGPQQIDTQSQGENAPFNQVILRAPGVAQDSFGQLHVRDEHANLQYRINDVLIPSFSVDAYYKAAKNLIDEGQFGAAVIFTPFNYARANQYGVEITAQVQQGGFSAYANFGFERGVGKEIVSSQFLFDADELAFIKQHYIFLDHDQRYMVSAGAAYTYKNSSVYVDMLYGSGLRTGFANTDELPGYYPVNLGLTHEFKLPDKFGRLQARFDVVNLFDQTYELRNGSGVGVFAPQFDPRRGFFGGLSWVF
jgi:hypothetical protein